MAEPHSTTWTERRDLGTITLSPVINHMKRLEFDQSPAGGCVMRSIESGSVSIETMVHVDYTSAAGIKSMCHQSRQNLNRLVPVNSLGAKRPSGVH